MSPNRKAFLNTVGVSEGTSTNPASKDRGYDMIVTGIDGHAEVFTDYSTHPFAGGREPKQVNSSGLKSTASGKYQIMLKNWLFYSESLHLPDFSPDSQDKIAIQLLRECHALDLIEAGRFVEAVYACRSRWASLPGANYPGQRMNTIAMLTKAYQSAGGTLG